MRSFNLQQLRFVEMRVSEDSIASLKLYCGAQDDLGCVKMRLEQCSFYAMLGDASPQMLPILKPAARGLCFHDHELLEFALSFRCFAISDRTLV